MKGLLDLTLTSSLTCLIIKAKIEKSLGTLDFYSFFPAGIERRQIQMMNAEEKDIQEFLWMSEVHNFEISGPVNILTVREYLYEPSA
jgi:hypothetical protein